MMTHLATLRERAEYLAGRVALKRRMGWEYAYDERERAALAWAIKELGKASGEANPPEDGLTILA